MILRRLVDHLRRHNWSSVAIELAIVVLGVFIGLQASIWNQEREKDATAAAFAAHLKEDLREENWGFQFLAAYYREVLENAERAAKALDGSAPLSDEALLVSAYRATQYKHRLRRRSTYDELISTGTIGLIRDRELRDTAMRVYQSYTIDNLTREGMGSRYREAFRMSLPNEVQRTLGRNCGDRPIRTGDLSAIHGTLEYRCKTGLSPEVVAVSAQALRANAALLPLLRLRVADVETRLGDLKGPNREFLERLRAIAAEGPAP